MITRGTTTSLANKLWYEFSKVVDLLQVYANCSEMDVINIDLHKSFRQG